MWLCELLIVIDVVNSSLLQDRMGQLATGLMAFEELAIGEKRSCDQNPNEANQQSGLLHSWDLLFLSQVP